MIQISSQFAKQIPYGKANAKMFTVISRFIAMSSYNRVDIEGSNFMDSL